MAGEQDAQRPDGPSSGGSSADDEPTLITPNVSDANFQPAPSDDPTLPLGPGHDQDRRELVASSFGDYELLEEVARGGMGVVYKARQRSLNRLVAVKMILAGQLASEDDIRRFRAEAEAAAGLQHPGIVAIHEVGENEGLNFFSMEFVEGRNLASLIREGPLPPVEAAEYVMTIAEAIAYAHQRGTLHRDLKPSNILIDAADNPRVTDFGLAKRIEGDSQLTGTGQILGTPSYMSPEQAAAKHEQIGPTTDVYSLGTILYESVTGRPPFQAATTLDTVLQVLEQEPVPPRTLNAAVPPDLETICLKCLEKEPQRRYQTAQELADELGRFQRGEPIVARPVSRPERFWRWCRRNSAVAILSAAVMLLLLAGTIISTYLAVTATLARREADVQRDLAIDREAEAQRLRRQEAELRKKEAAARQQAEAERQRAQQNLRASLVHQAEALQRSTTAGRKRQALDALRQAADIQPGADLRTLALRCLDQYDMRPLTFEKNSRRANALVKGSQNLDQVVLVPSSSFLRMYQRRTGEPMGYLGGVKFKRPGALAADGRILAANQGNERAAVWDVRGRKVLGPLRDAGNQPVSAYGLAVSDDSRLIALAPPSTVDGVHSILLFEA